MHRVMKRTWVIHVFLLILLCGMTFFLWEYMTEAQTWVAATGSPHLYNNSNIGCGTIADRSGTVLLDISSSRSYGEDALTRKSTLHWLGDRKGFISAAAVSNYADEMAGYDKINGVYAASGEAGYAQLTLSARVQNTALEALGDRKGTVAVYNYKTGEILCAVTSPNFDPDDVPDIEGDESGKWDGVYLNRFTQSSYIPGSVYKVVTTAAALEHIEGIKDMTFHCSGRVEYGSGSNVAAVTCEKKHGDLDLRGALANSCNCAFAEIAALLGRKDMESTVEKLRITKPVEFDGVTTARGNYDLADAGAASFAWSCIGQHTDTINPARFMTFMGAIAGGGQAVKPYLVSEVICGENVTYQAKPEKEERILSEDVAATLKDYLRNNVKNVYGDSRFPAIGICGKSGTSQVGGGKTSNALFAGFANSERYPLAFVCVVENGGYGAATCIPILSNVLWECMAVMDAE